MDSSKSACLRDENSFLKVQEDLDLFTPLPGLVWAFNNSFFTAEKSILEESIVALLMLKILLAFDCSFGFSSVASLLFQLLRDSTSFPSEFFLTVLAGEPFQYSSRPRCLVSWGSWIYQPRLVASRADRII